MIFMHSLMITPESASRISGKCWGNMLSRHLLNIHEGLGKEKIDLKTPTQPCDHHWKYRDSRKLNRREVFANVIPILGVQ